MRIGPYTSMAAAPGTDFSGLANLMAMKGRGGDNTLVHMSKAELPYLNMLAKSAGYPKGLPVNPETGLPEANILKTILPVAGAILGGMFFPPSLLGLGAGSALATGVGAGLGSFGGSLLSGRSLKDAAIGGLISGGLAGVGSAVFGGGEAALGDPVVQGTTGAAGPDIVGPQLASVQGTGASEFVGQGLPELGGFGPVTSTDFSAAMPATRVGLEGALPVDASGASLGYTGTPFVSSDAYVPSNLSVPGTYGQAMSGPPIGTNLAAFKESTTGFAPEPMLSKEATAF